VLARPSTVATTTPPHDPSRRAPGSDTTGGSRVSDYLPILLLIGVATAFAVGSVGVSSLVGPSRPNPTKLDAYECGNEPLAHVKDTRFSVKFYLVAMMFLIFDVETVFLYPWATVFRDLGWFGLAQMGLFLGVLGVVFLYELAKGGLEWD
jgi:NADH-quinone oxidoreductase subunit A